MSKRNPPARYTLPLVLNPTSHKCFVINVPNDIYHIAAFRGQMEALAHAYAWHNDAEHTAKDVAQVWRSVLDGMETCMPQIQFRQPSDCALEVSYDGGATWDEIYSSYACAVDAVNDAVADGTIPIPVQPPAAGSIPGQECRTYHVVLSANDQWHSPVPVFAGFNITVSNIRGGWTDGVAGGVTWQCPTGHIYALGICQSLEVSAQTGDPMMSVNHMKLIGLVSEYFDAYGGTYVVPDGVGETDLIFQANDSDLSDNRGSIEFDVEICNYGEWRHDFYFDTGAHGWYAFSSFSTLESDGWHGIAAEEDTTKNYIGINLPSTANITACLATVTIASVHDLTSMFRGKTGANWTGTITFDFTPDIAVGRTLTNELIGNPVTGGSGTNYILTAAWGNGSSAANIIHHIRLYGRGTEPTWA